MYVYGHYIFFIIIKIKILQEKIIDIHLHPFLRTISSVGSEHPEFTSGGSQVLKKIKNNGRLAQLVQIIPNLLREVHKF